MFAPSLLAPLVSPKLSADLINSFQQEPGFNIEIVLPDHSIRDLSLLDEARISRNLRKPL